MDKRKFGNTDMNVSKITFGAWSIGGPAVLDGIQVGWSGVDDDVSLRAIDTAYDNGINIYDTADSYAEGHSEKLLGKALSGKRATVYISTKVGLTGAAEGKFKLDFSKSHIRESCESSLKRLGTDYVDIYLLHMVTDGYPLTDEMKDVLDMLKKEGKIRHYGVSVQFPHQGMEQIQKSFGDSMMIEHNMLTGSEVDNTLESAKNKGMGIITRGALAKGLLTGKYKKGHRFDKDDVRSRLDSEYIDNLLDKVEKLNKYAMEVGSDLLTIALAYQFRNEACSTVTVGLKTPEQVREVTAAAQNSIK